MVRELNMHMNLYLKMKEGETKEEAEIRFENTINELKSQGIEITYQIYETEEQELNI